jgi:hypothetical protein
MIVDVKPGDLCRYMSRTLLIIGEPFLDGPSCKPWVESIEIDDNTFRRVRCDTLTLIQRAKENDNDQRI